MASMAQSWLNWKWYFDAKLRERALAEWTAFGVLAIAVLFMV